MRGIINFLFFSNPYDTATPAACTGGNDFHSSYWLGDTDHSNLFATFFNVNVLVGSMPLGMAKFVDVAFDVIVGRGGQAVLSYANYHVIGASVTYIMESESVSYELFARASMDSTTIFSIGPLLTSIFRRPSSAYKITHRVMMAWSTLSVLWVGFYLTLLSAMTGYVANTQALVRLAEGGRLIDFKDFYSTSEMAFRPLSNEPSLDSQSASSLPIADTINISGPNTTLFTELSSDYKSRPNWFDFPIDVGNQTYMAYFAINNFSYPCSYPQYSQNVLCADTNTYQWGISFNLTIIAIIANGLWTIGTYAIWMHLKRKSEFRRKRRQIGKSRAVIDMAEAIMNELGPHTCGYSEKEIEAELKKRPPIRYQVFEDDERDEAHIGLSSVQNGGD